MTNPYAPPQAVVDDVIDPAAGIVLADRSTRFGASLLDGLIFGALVYAPLLVGGVLSALTRARSPQEGISGALPYMAVLGLVGFTIWMWFTVKLLKANGQSIGKKACGIKLVRQDGSPVSVSRVIWLRNVLNGAIGFIPLYAFIDSLFIFGEAHRCVHDYIADTIVIKA
jgi:uncharacterized RDD family membrane protein YckC